MKKEDISSAIGKVSEKYVEEACQYKTEHKPKAKTTTVRRWVAFAACVILIAATFPIGIMLQNVGWFTPIDTGTVTTAGGEESEPFGESTNHDKPYIPIESTPGLEYQVHSDGKTCTITGIGDCEYKSEIVVGDTIDGYRVTGIEGNAFAVIKYSNGIEGWKIYPLFTKITIGKSVTFISNDAFYDKNDIKEVYYTGDAEDWCKISFGGYYANPMHAGAKLYFNNELVTDIVIPDSITAIGANQFEGCASLKSVVIPGSVESIAPNAFWECTSLKSVVFSEGVKSIGSNAFAECYNLERVSFPSTLSEINAGAFMNCVTLKSISIPKSVSTIKSSVFKGCRSLTSVILPDSITTLEYSAFRGCSALKELTLPNSLTTISDYALACGIKRITLPISIESIGKNSFANTTQIYYDGTKEEWKSISKADAPGEGIYLHSIACTDGFFFSPPLSDNSESGR